MSARPKSRSDGLLAVPAHQSDRAGLALGSGGAQPFGERAGVVDVAAGQRERELLAAVASEHVGGAQLRRPRGGDLLQQPVAGLMAVVVVVDLELVEVGEPHAERRPLALRPRELALERLVPRAPVGQAGEVVGARHLRQGRHQVGALLGEGRRVARHATHPPDERVDQKRAERHRADRGDPARDPRRGVEVEQQPGVGGADRAEVGDRDRAREEEHRVQPDPDEEEGVEAARLAAVVSRAGDQDDPDEQHHVQAPHRELPGGGGQTHQPADVGEGDVAPQRPVVERRGVRNDQRETTDRRPHTEEHSGHQPHEARAFDRLAGGRHDRGFLSPQRMHVVARVALVTCLTSCLSGH